MNLPVRTQRRIAAKMFEAHGGEKEKSLLLTCYGGTYVHTSSPIAFAFWEGP
jgi:hypothetical protein